MNKTSILAITALTNIFVSLVHAEEPQRSSWQPGTRHPITDTVSFGGTYRMRYEHRSDFKFGDPALGNNEDYFLHQLRLNLKLKPTAKSEFFIESQSSFINDDRAVDEHIRPNAFAEDFDLHQAYGSTSFALGDISSTLKVGRQKLSFGEQRLVGPLEWSNVARVFDAVLLTLGDSAHRAMQLFSSRAVPVDPDNFNDWGYSGNRYADGMLHGAYYTDKEVLPTTTTDLYYLLRDSKVADDSVHTVGARVKGKMNSFDYGGEGAYQFGDFGGLTHEAWMAHLESGLTVDDATKSRLGIAYNYGSGDSSSTDKRHETFDNLYPTNHAYYGYMDFAALENLHNLECTVERTVADTMSLRVAYQNFWLAQPTTDSWYNSGLVKLRSAGADVSSYLGSELDVTLRQPLFNKRVTLEATYGHFFSGSYIEQTGASKDADFFILMATVEL